MLKFDDPKNAFRHLSDAKLKESFRLFKLLSAPVLGKLGPFLGEKAFKWKVPFSSRISQKLFRQFCGGEDLEESLETVKSFHERGVGSIIDYSAEGEVSEKGFAEASDKVREAILFAASNQDEGPLFTVFKCTGLCSFALLEKKQKNPESFTDSDHKAYQTFVDRVDELCGAAAENKVSLFIDAEESWIQDSIDAIAEQMMQKYNRGRVVVYHTIQMYRTDRLLYLSELYKRAKSNEFLLGLKVVRGAYIEKENKYAKSQGIPSAIHQTKEGSDKDFDHCVDFCLTHLDTISVCIATHNENSIAKAVRKTPKNPPLPVIYSQLLGMGEHLTMALAAENQPVVKLIPYGPIDKVMPYLMRRAQENSSVQGQVGKELKLLHQEMQNRNLL